MQLYAEYIRFQYPQLIFNSVIMAVIFPYVQNLLGNRGKWSNGKGYGVVGHGFEMS